MTGRDYLVDECGPIVWPFLLEYGNEDEVELVEEGSLFAQAFFGAGGLDDEIDDKVSNA